MFVPPVNSQFLIGTAELLRIKRRCYIPKRKEFLSENDRFLAREQCLGIDQRSSTRVVDSPLTYRTTSAPVLKLFASCPTNNSVPPCSLGDTATKGGAIKAILNQDPYSQVVADSLKNCEARLPSRIN
jgi:hypothetical protein